MRPANENSRFIEDLRRVGRACRLWWPLAVMFAVGAAFAIWPRV